MIPGEVMPRTATSSSTRAARRSSLDVANTGDRPIQVGSHYHFAETNDALAFDRAAARGFRLNIAAGTAVRFEPGQTRTVELVALAGERDGVRLHGRSDGRARREAQACGAKTRGASDPMKIARRAYAEMFGPTTGDRVRLADTELVVEVERDLTVYGEEVKFGGGKVIRDGMGQSQRRVEGLAPTR